ncbi:hypothetical protein C1645_173788 [Glomus cerebriforme]|uniref:C2H2-type domain-containing protein n=1 Tax=Glomus cerebriforme TaxID=658196 RepID=A0A397TNY0_9GLOM|nr:hypothetical protein C1645_173788 [Glomus cerebriforme]
MKLRNMEELASKKVLDKFYQEYVIEVEPQHKFKCKVCGKLFKGADFVRKHIEYKHHDTVEAITKFFNSYVLYFQPHHPNDPIQQLH